MSEAHRSGPARIVASGTVTTFFGHPLELVLAQPEGPITVVLQFLDGPAPHVESTPLPHGWRLDLTGFDGADGRGSADPVLVGELGDDLLFLHFRVFRYGGSPDRTVHYTFHRASKADVGWQPVTEDPA